MAHLGYNSTKSFNRTQKNFNYTEICTVFTVSLWFIFIVRFILDRYPTQQEITTDYIGVFSEKFNCSFKTHCTRYGYSYWDLCNHATIRADITLTTNLVECQNKCFNSVKCDFYRFNTINSECQLIRFI